MANRPDPTHEVTFITPTGELEIRFTDNSLPELCRAARTLKARWFVAVDGWSDRDNAPIWGVFDMRTAQRDTPTPGQWSINDPTKTFVTERSDAAVMWALAQGRA